MDEVLIEHENRRNLRRSIKNNIEDMHQNRSELTKLNSNKFSDALSKTNKYFGQAEHTRELTFDAHAMRELSHALKQQALTLNDLSKKYDFKALSLQLLQIFSDPATNSFDWKTLGGKACTVFSSTAPVTTMNGPVDKEIKMRKLAQKRALNDDEDDVVVKPSEIIQNGTDQDEGMSKRVRYLKSTIKSSFGHSSSGSTSGTEESADFDVLRLLVHPTDPIQTIENFFDFSFLIKVVSFIYYNVILKN